MERFTTFIGWFFKLRSDGSWLQKNMPCHGWPCAVDRRQADLDAVPLGRISVRPSMYSHFELDQSAGRSADLRGLSPVTHL